MSYDAIIFDMDGTLVDWSPFNAIAWNKSFAKRGWEGKISEDDFKKYAGHTSLDIGKMVFPDIDENEANRRIIEVSHEETETIRELARLENTYFKDLTFFEQLSKKFRLFIVSNCVAGYIEAFLDIYGANKYIEGFLDNRDGISKDENIKRIVNQYDLKNPIYVGDTIMDENAARKAGVQFVFASYGFGKSEASLKIKDIHDLLNF